MCFLCILFKILGQLLQNGGIFILFHTPHIKKKKREKKVLKGKRKEKQIEKMNPISTLQLVSKPFPLEKHGKGTFYRKEISWDSRIPWVKVPKSFSKTLFYHSLHFSWFFLT